MIQPWWLMPAAFAVHMLDEMIWLPRWSLTAGGWHAPVGRREFAFASVVVVALVFVAAGAGALGGRESVGVYLMAGVAVLMVVNFFVPHAGSAFQTRRYAPGILTSAFIMVPVSALFIWQVLTHGYILWLPFIAAATGVLLGAAIFWPKLFGLGRRLFGWVPPVPG